MINIYRRSLLKLIGFAATGTLIPGAGGKNLIKQARGDTLDKLYEVPMAGNVRILHSTDIHGQLLPVYFREANVNIGVGEAKVLGLHRV